MTPVYFVIPETQRKKWPAQLHEAALGQYSVDEIAAFFTAGVDVHILQTWLLLKEREREFSFHLVSHAVKDEICVFHYDNAKPRHGLLDCFSIVVRADRPPVPYADIVLEQNPLASGAAWHMPHWVQPGLIPRDESRADRLERIALVGSRQYQPSWVFESAFLKLMSDLGIELTLMDAGNWCDYSRIDAIVALRPGLSLRVLQTKPASKLINAWAAGTPALLGVEPAYQALRSHPLDYLEITGPESLLCNLRRIKQTPGLYAALRQRCALRAPEGDRARVCARWLDLFTHAAEMKKRNAPHCRARKMVFYTGGRLHTAFLKRSGLWKD